MTSADKYLAMSLDLLSKAERETDPHKRARLEALAESYRRMVEFDLPRKDDGKTG
jgi:hypothetical protein